MKIIDLLNKIANGEELPFLIKYEDIILKYDLEGQDYRIYQNGYLFAKLFEREDCKFLNDEVEILEEEKKIPEKLNKNYYITQPDINQPSKVSYDMGQLLEMVQDIYEKQGEICDYLKSKGE